MHTIKRFLLSLPAAFVLLVMAAANASAFHPLFLTASGKTLSFTGSGGLARLRALNLGLLGTIDCEKGAASGELLNESTLARKIELEFSGKCLETLEGASLDEKCSEPIKLKLAFGELGLLNKKAVVLVAPESGTEFAAVKCESTTTVVKGAVVGEIPEAGEGVGLTAFELVFKAANGSELQAITEIELLGVIMKGIHLSVEGFFGGQASEETTETIYPDEEGGPKVHPQFLTASGKALSFTGSSGLSRLRGLNVGVLGTIDCEEGTTSGEILNKSTFVRKIELEYKGKCEQTVGTSKGTCTEPVKLKLAFGELGLLNKKTVLLVAPESGTTFVTVECTNGNTTVGGALIGEIPEAGESVGLTAFELVFKAVSGSDLQAITEIELLGMIMKGIRLSVEGFFGGQASEETTVTIDPDGEVGSTSKPHPLFFTQSGKALSFTGSSGVSTLRALDLGVLGTLACEKGTSSGELLNESTLARKIELEFFGKCLQKINGATTQCNEPIVFRLSSGELGLINRTRKVAVLLLVPESETNFVTIECGSNTTTITGAVVGEFPEVNHESRNQYNKDLKNYELVFRAEGESEIQAIREINLLNLQMANVELKVSGSFSGKASEEDTQTLAVDGEALIDTI